MKIEVLKEPYDDNKMKWNSETAHYELTLSFVKSHFDYLCGNFKDDGILQNRITKNSRIIYNYIFKKVATENKEVVTFFLNRTEGGRNYLFDALCEQMEADLLSGYNDLGVTPAINVSNGQVIDRNVLRENEVAVATEDIIDRSEQYCGINLLYSSRYPSSLFLFCRCYL